MIDALQAAFSGMFGCPCMFDIFPQRLAFLLLGASIGLIVGAIPGLGGLVGLALILPFTLEMDGFSAVVLAIGLLSTLNTSDTIPAVLFAVPGTNAAQATVMDGYPMAKNGLAARALGAAYMASMMGGLFGAVVLAVSVPLLRPIVLSFGSPEFFILGMLGISMVAVLSGNAPLRGLIVAMIGLAAGMVGADPQIGVLRWTGGQLYLFDGLPLIPIALGLFAVPEMVDLLISGRRRLSDGGMIDRSTTMVGIKDAFRNWFLVIRCSAIGVWIGAIPGLGGAVVDWLAYGHALQTEKGASETFGTGDVRGVIAPESANNAKEGGALIPTIAFGVPGSAAMALLLTIFLMKGIVPGPAMLTTNLDVTYTLVWGIAIANIFGTMIVLLLGNKLARVADVSPQLLAPFVIAVVMVAALQATQNVGDMLVAAVVGVMGWFMKRLAIPRPPLLLAFILSPILENYFFISTSRYGASWLGRPIVVTVIIMIAVSIGYAIWVQRRAKGGPNVAA